MGIPWVAIWVWFGILAAATILVAGTVFTVRQQTSAVIERLGKFNRVAGAGLRFKIPFIERVAGRLTLRIEQMEVRVETKTEDNVFVVIPVAVHHFVQPLKVFDAFYKLGDPKAQIEAFVLDVVRGKVPEIRLDDLFKSKEDVARAVKDSLTKTMDAYGYTITQVLVVDIDPEVSVKAAMNKINAAQRERVAANDTGEAEKTLKVKAAEAEAESMKLHGQGIADQRAAITMGLRRSLRELKDAAPGMHDKEVMATIMLAQYFDAMRDMAQNSGSRTIFFPHSPGAVGDLWQQMAMGALSAEEAPPAVIPAVVAGKAKANGAIPRKSA